MYHIYISFWINGCINQSHPFFLPCAWALLRPTCCSLHATVCTVVYPRPPPGAPSERRFFCLKYDTKTRSSIVCFESAQLAGCCAANMTKSHERKSALLKTTPFKFPSQSKKTNKQKKTCTYICVHQTGAAWTRYGAAQNIFWFIANHRGTARVAVDNLAVSRGILFPLCIYLVIFYLGTLALAAKSRVQPAGLVCTLHAAGRFVNITT